LGENLGSNLGTDRIFRVAKPTNSDEKVVMGKLLTDFHLFVDVFGHTEAGIDIRVKVDKLDLFKTAGIKHVDTTDEWMAHFSANFANKTFICQDSAATCAQDSTFYNSYQRLAAIETRLESIHTANPAITSVESLGQSYEGKSQTAITIKRGSTKPTVFYFCGEHAREWLPVMFCVWMAEQLAADGGHPLLDHVQFTILPVMNPDGYEYSMTTNNMWRKSRMPNSGTSCIGTDLNRNYGQAHCGQGSSTSQCSETYCGTAAFDNKETANMKAFAERVRTEGGSIIVQTDVHAYGQMWMNPYGSTKTLPPNYADMKAAGDATADAIRGVSGYRFVTGTIADVIYVASGSSCDWFYTDEGVIYAYAPEVRGTSFQPSTSQIKPSNDELFAGMVAQVEYAIAHPGVPTPAPPTPAPTPAPPAPTPGPPTPTPPAPAPTPAGQGCNDIPPADRFPCGGRTYVTEAACKAAPGNCCWSQQPITGIWCFDQDR
jgi:murein tripeptide amidase MpaA